jgi:hypothetical protein
MGKQRGTEREARGNEEESDKQSVIIRVYQEKTGLTQKVVAL